MYIYAFEIYNAYSVASSAGGESLRRGARL